MKIDDFVWEHADEEKTADKDHKTKKDAGGQTEELE